MNFGYSWIFNLRPSRASKTRLEPSKITNPKFESVQNLSNDKLAHITNVDLDEFTKTGIHDFSISWINKNYQKIFMWDSIEGTQF
jgi:hypothetical protein